MLAVINEQQIQTLDAWDDEFECEGYRAWPSTRSSPGAFSPKHCMKCHSEASLGCAEPIVELVLASIVQPCLVLSHRLISLQCLSRKVCLSASQHCTAFPEEGSWQNCAISGTLNFDSQPNVFQRRATMCEYQKMFDRLCGVGDG